MKPVNNLFLIEIDFCSVVINKGLVLNLSLYLLSFFNWAWLSRILLMESKKFQERYIYSEVSKYGANLLQNSQEWTLHN